MSGYGYTLPFSTSEHAQKPVPLRYQGLERSLQKRSERKFNSSGGFSRGLHVTLHRLANEKGRFKEALVTYIVISMARLRNG